MNCPMAQCVGWEAGQKAAQGDWDLAMGLLIVFGVALTLVVLLQLVAFWWTRKC